MKTLEIYIVRTEDKHDLIGIFCARNQRDLFFLVDEREDPTVCEYAEMPHGGIFCTDTLILKRNIPDKHGEYEQRTIPTAYYGFTEEWDSILRGHGVDHLDWKDFSGKLKQRQDKTGLMQS